MFTDRRQAGQLLAQRLEKYKGAKDVLILALPRGGVIVAAEVAKLLRLPLDIIITRKIGHPANPEYAVGACGEHVLFTGPQARDIDPEYLGKEVKVQREEIKRRYQAYLGQKPLADLKNKTVIIIDDGIATGLTMQAAIEEAKSQKPEKIIVAVPVAPPDAVKKIRPMTDELIVLDIPFMFFAVGQFYENFPQTTDEEVIEILKSRNQ